MARFPFTCGLTVLLLSGTLAACRGGGSDTVNAAPQQATPVTVAPVTTREVAVTIDATGSFAAAESSDVAPEASGRIVAVGAGVPDGRIGERVAIEPQRPCRVCAQCSAGRYNLCPFMEFYATPPIDGAGRKVTSVCHLLAARTIGTISSRSFMPSAASMCRISGKPGT